MSEPDQDTHMARELTAGMGPGTWDDQIDALAPTEEAAREILIAARRIDLEKASVEAETKLVSAKEAVAAARASLKTFDDTIWHLGLGRTAETIKSQGPLRKLLHGPF